MFVTIKFCLCIEFISEFIATLVQFIRTSQCYRTTFSGHKHAAIDFAVNTFMRPHRLSVAGSEEKTLALAVIGYSL